jgi:hypothetical protein
MECEIVRFSVGGKNKVFALHRKTYILKTVHQTLEIARALIWSAKPSDIANRVPPNMECEIVRFSEPGKNKVFALHIKALHSINYTPQTA